MAGGRHLLTSISHSSFWLCFAQNIEFVLQPQFVSFRFLSVVFLFLSFFPSFFSVIHFEASITTKYHDATFAKNLSSGKANKKSISYF